MFVDGEPLNQNQEDMLARNTFAQADSAMNLVATAADVSLNFVSVLSYFKMDFMLHFSWIL